MICRLGLCHGAIWSHVLYFFKNFRKCFPTDCERASTVTLFHLFMFVLVLEELIQTFLFHRIVKDLYFAYGLK